jgi:hypothetical protein
LNENIKKKKISEITGFIGGGLNNDNGIGTRITEGYVIDSLCHNFTAKWFREKVSNLNKNNSNFQNQISKSISEFKLCDFFENLENSNTEVILPPGVYSLNDIKKFFFKFF